MKKRLSTGPGLVIGIPTLGRPIPLEWAFAFKSLSPPSNYNCIIHVVNNQEVANARNEIAKVAIEKDAKYLFFLGDDVVPPNHTLRQLILHMENNPNIGVIGGVYCSKTEPPAPLVFRGNGQGSYWDWKIGEVFEVTGMGMDCTLIRVQVLKDLLVAGITEQFKTVDSDGFLDGINNAESWTEDLYFFDKMEKFTPQWKIFIDGGVICQRWDVYARKFYTVPTGTLPMRQLVFPVKSRKCLMLGPEIPINDAEKGDFEIVKAGMFEGADYRCDLISLPFEKETFDWVIVTDPGFTFLHPEWTRVLKTAGKLSVNYNSFLDLKKIMTLNPGLTEEPNGMLVYYKEAVKEANV